jgi:phosphoglycolate phosphatase-like HAD superfamily hydrolase
MIGDSAVDVQTARNAGVRACGVRWGFQPETFAGSPPDFLIDDLRELAGRVLK